MINNEYTVEKIKHYIESNNDIQIAIRTYTQKDIFGIMECAA